MPGHSLDGIPNTGPHTLDHVKRRTSTRSFGAGNRQGHDASTFYARKLCSSFVGKEAPRGINPAQISGARDFRGIPPETLDQVFHHSCESMPELPDNSVALMVTSPPYNVGKEYDGDLSLDEYLAFLKRVLQETYRVLLPGGRVAFNVANLGRKPYIPLNGHVAALACEIGFLMRGEIIWVKGKGANGSCAWGSWMSPANPTLRDLHEYVLIFSKARFDHPGKGRPTISREEFMAATTSVWHIPPESARRVGHPAPFPVALVERLIHLYTFERDLILDPFMGSGSTAVAARRANRCFVGYEIDAQYIAICKERLSSLEDRSLSA